MKTTIWTWDGNADFSFIIWANHNKIAVMTCTMILFLKRLVLPPSKVNANLKVSVSLRVPFFITTTEQLIKSKIIPNY